MAAVLLIGALCGAGIFGFWIGIHAADHDRHLPPPRPTNKEPR